MSLRGLLTSHGAPPDLVSVGLIENGDGDTCGAGGTVHVTISWVVSGAPDAAYHIDIDGVASDLAPSDGAYVHDTGFSANRSQGTPTEHQDFGPYTVRLIRTDGAVEVENQATGTAGVDYSLDACV